MPRVVLEGWLLVLQRQRGPNGLPSLTSLPRPSLTLTLTLIGVSSVTSYAGQRPTSLNPVQSGLGSGFNVRFNIGWG